jgi:hypothetical protein
LRELERKLLDSSPLALKIFPFLTPVGWNLYGRTKGRIYDDEERRVISRNVVTFDERAQD